MPDVTFKEQVHQLIAEDRLEAAGDELSRYWAGRHRGLHAATLQAGRRLRTLRERQVKGTISMADADVERARITELLLAVADQVDQPAPALPPEQEAGADEPAKRRWLLLALLLLAALLLVGYVFYPREKEEAASAEPFSLELYLQTTTEGVVQPLANGRVEVLLGDHHLPVMQSNAAGAIAFDHLPAKYLDDSIRVLPVNMRYRVVRQSAYLPGASRRITVELAPLPDTTLWRGAVVSTENKPVAGARIDIESGLAEAMTDERGYFNVAVPLREGEKIQVEVFVRGRRLRDAAYTLTGTEPARIILENRRDQRTQR